MVGGVFSSAKLNDTNAIHQKILENGKAFGKGIYIISMVLYNQNKVVKNEANLLFATAPELYLTNITDETNLQIYKRLVEQYCFYSQYCIGLEVIKETISACTIPVLHPEELEHVLHGAIARYQNTIDIRIS